MNIEPKEGVVIVRQHTQTATAVKITLVDEEQERSLTTGEIIAGKNKGKTAIFGKYALLDLMIQGEKVSFLEEKDIIGFTQYTEEK